MTYLHCLVGAATAAGILATASHAQDEQRFVEAFSGSWYVFDDRYHAGEEPCRIDLERADAMPLPGTATGCTAPLSGTAAWSIVDGTIVLEDGEGAELSILGGNQFRLTGQLSDADGDLIMDRAQGDGTSATLARAVRRHGCYFSGFESTCASSETLSPPPSEGARLTALADLNVRMQPRRDAGILGVVSQGTTISTETCLETADGYWCNAMFGEDMGWIARSAMRQDEWPIITFSAANPSDT